MSRRPPTVRRQSGDEAIALVGQSLVPITDLHDTFVLVYSLVALATALRAPGDVKGIGEASLSSFLTRRGEASS